MNTEINKYLTEQLGECWHKYGNYVQATGYTCHKCFKVSGCQINNDFSTPDGFFKLWNWSKQQDWWYAFRNTMWKLHVGDYDEYEYDDLASYIDPEKFANALYKFLKEKQSGGKSI